MLKGQNFEDEMAIVQDLSILHPVTVCGERLNTDQHASVKLCGERLTSTEMQIVSCYCVSKPSFLTLYTGMRFNPAVKWRLIRHTDA